MARLIEFEVILESKACPYGLLTLGIGRSQGMSKWLVLYIFLFLTGVANVLQAEEHFPDRPESTHDSCTLFETAASYVHALKIWKTPEDISAWIAANFSYDMARAMRLSETQRAKHGPLPIYTPSDFFSTRAGVCVDLARFAVETLRAIDSQSDPKYLMIEFDPVDISGNMLRRHWLVSFKRDGKTYFFADSRRPGHIAGPYNDPREFIQVYERYRGRKIVAFREMDSYQKRQRTQVLKLQTSEKP
jgi:hypothetical protein